MANQLATTGGNPLSISTLSARLTDLTERLQPASEDAIAAALLKLNRAGLAYPPGLDAKAAGRVYGYSMKAIPIEGLKRAIEKIMRGEVEGQNPNFIPTAPAFASIARKEAAALYADSARIRETIDAIEAGRALPPDPKDPEAIERVRKLRKMVLDTAEALRAEDGPGEIPDRFFRNREAPDPDAERSVDERWAEAMRGEGDD